MTINYILWGWKKVEARGVSKNFSQVSDVACMHVGTKICEEVTGFAGINKLF